MDSSFVKKFIKDSKLENIDIGCSGNSVRHIVKSDGEYYIKHSKGNKLDKEYFMFNYLKDKL